MADADNNIRLRYSLCMLVPVTVRLVKGNTKPCVRCNFYRKTYRDKTC